MEAEWAEREFKQHLDLDRPDSMLKFVKEIVALANAGGGTIIVGVLDDGTAAHKPPAPIDPASLADKVDSFISPDHLEVRVVPVEFSFSVVVPPVRQPPLVMSKDGTFGSGKQQKSIFRRGDVYVRSGTKAQPATRQNYVDWAEELREQTRNQLLERLKFVASLPEGATLAAISGEEEIDEPTALLSRSSRAYQLNPEKLLTANELLVLLQALDDLHPTDEQWEVLIQSALRRKTTLWFWIAKWAPDPHDVEALLVRAINGRDRDKSDAGRSILEVAAVFLEAPGYGRVVAQLAASNYKHFVSAAETWPELQACRSRIFGLLQDVGSTDVDERSPEQLLNHASALCVQALGGPVSKAVSASIYRSGMMYFAGAFFRKSP
jgi:hypothetical protein